MPSRTRKDFSDDLKQAVVRMIRAGNSYRHVAQQLDISVGSISAIIKVGHFYPLCEEKILALSVMFWHRTVFLDFS